MLQKPQRLKYFMKQWRFNLKRINKIVKVQLYMKHDHLYIVYC